MRTLRSRLTRRAVGLVLVVSLLAFVPGSAMAVQAGGSVTVPAGTVHEGDMTVFGGTVVIEGTVDGSIEGFAGSIVVAGTVTGDIEAAAGSLTVPGVVEGDVELAAGDVSIPQGGRIGGSLSVGSGSLSLDGTVGGDVEAGVGTLSVGETAQVGGNLVYDAETVSIADGASIGGETRRVDSLTPGVPLPIVGDVGIGAIVISWVFAVVGFVVNFLLGALLLLAAPRFSERVTDRGATDPLRSGAIGFLVLVGVPVVLILLAITIIGIPFTIAGLLAFLLMVWVAFVYGALITGSWLLTKADYPSRWGGLALGLLIPTLLSFIAFGDILSFFYLLLGLGSFSLTLLAMRRGGEETPAPEETPSTESPAA